MQILTSLEISKVSGGIIVETSYESVPAAWWVQRKIALPLTMPQPMSPGLFTK
ncbi:hypothetical protein [Massilia sp. S19_KUP03_FR1]|uniref:hypothetical protein n=1 Tax=Massilia sp. S19_KUP03_FR1 TaxID=3025503 RepID=UPI002FCD9DF1